MLTVNNIGDLIIYRWYLVSRAKYIYLHNETKLGRRNTCIVTVVIFLYNQLYYQISHFDPDNHVTY